MSNPSAPVLSSFQFNTIGKPPSLLQRLAEPGATTPSPQHNLSPSPSPKANVSELPPTIQPLNRPSLLEQLTTDHDAPPSFSPNFITNPDQRTVDPGVQDIFKVTLSPNVDTAPAVGPFPHHVQTHKPTATMSTFCLSLPPDPEAPSPFTSLQLDSLAAPSVPAATATNLTAKASASTSARPSSSPNVSTLPLPPTLPMLSTSSLTAADLYRYIAELSNERIELQETRFARQRVADEHREYVRRHVEAQTAAEREKEQMAKLVSSVQDALDKMARVRERQERRWTEESARIQKAVKAMEEEEERKRLEQEADVAASKAKAEAEERARQEAEEAEAREKAVADEKAKAAEAEAKAKAAAQAQAKVEAENRARVERERQERLRQQKEKDEHDRLQAIAAKAEAEMARALAAKTRQAAEEKLRAEVKAKAQAAAAERLRADTEAKKRAELAKLQQAELNAKTHADQTIARDATQLGRPAIVKVEPLLPPMSKISDEHSVAPKQVPQLPVAREAATIVPSDTTNQSLLSRASNVQATPSLSLPHSAERVARPATQPPRSQTQTPAKACQQLTTPVAPIRSTSTASSEASIDISQTQSYKSHKAASKTPTQIRTRQEELRVQLLEQRLETKSTSGVSATPLIGAKQCTTEGSNSTSSLKIARSVWPPVSTQSAPSSTSYTPSKSTTTQPQLSTPSTTHIETRSVPASVRTAPSGNRVEKTVPHVQVKAEPDEVPVPRKSKERPVPSVEQQPTVQTVPAATVAVPPSISLPPKPAVPLPAPRPQKSKTVTTQTVQSSPHNHHARNGDKSGRLPPVNATIDAGRNLIGSVAQQVSAGSGSKPARPTDKHVTSRPQTSFPQWRTDQDDDGWVTTPRDEFDRLEQSYRSPTPERRYDHYSPSPDRQSMRHPDYYPPSRYLAARDRQSPVSRKRLRDMYPEESSHYKRPRYDNQPRTRSPYTSRRSDRAYTPPSPPVRYKSPLLPPPPRHRSPTPLIMARYSPVRAPSPYNLRPSDRAPELPTPQPFAPSTITIPERRRPDYGPSTEESSRINAKVSTAASNRKAAPQVQPTSGSESSSVWRAEKPTPVSVPQSRTDLLSRMSDVPQYGQEWGAPARSDSSRARRGNPKGRGRGGSVTVRGGGGSNRLVDRFQDRPQPQKDLESRISTW
jgi:hypothetical protein